MPSYRVLERSYIGDRIVEADEIVDFNGRPGPNLEPADEEAEKHAKAMAKGAPPDAPADPVAVGDLS